MVHLGDKVLFVLSEVEDCLWLLRSRATEGHLACLFSFFFCVRFPKSSNVICAQSSSQLKVTRCLQIKSCSFNRTG